MAELQTVRKVKLIRACTVRRAGCGIASRFGERFHAAIGYATVSVLDTLSSCNEVISVIRNFAAGFLGAAASDTGAIDVAIRSDRLLPSYPAPGLSNVPAHSGRSLCRLLYSACVASGDSGFEGAGQSMSPRVSSSGRAWIVWTHRRSRMRWPLLLKDERSLSSTTPLKGCFEHLSFSAVRESTSPRSLKRTLHRSRTTPPSKLLFISVPSSFLV